MRKRVHKKILVFFVVLSSVALNIAGANYYWVGNGGNWNNLARWASSSGGVGNAYATPPTTSDNVFFDANSFSSGSQTVTINVNASCANINFTGVTNNPTLGGTNAFSLTCTGSLTFVAGITYTFAGDVNFTGTGVHTITSAGKTFLRNILFNGTGGQWTLQDALIVTSQLGLQAGTFVMNGMAVSCGTLNANIVDNARSINFGASYVTVTGSGTCVDLRGNTANLSLAVGTSTISCTTTANLTIQVGTSTKSIPNLLFPNITSGNVGIYSGVTTNRITFGSITKSLAAPTYAGTFYIDYDVEGAKKTFGRIEIAANTSIQLNSYRGSNYGVGDGGIYTDDVVVGDNCAIEVQGAYSIFQGDVTFGANMRRTAFWNQTQIDGTLSIVSTNTGAGGSLNLQRGAVLNGPVIITGETLFRVSAAVYHAIFNSTLTIGDSTTVTMIIGNNSTLTFNDDITIGNKTNLIVGDGTANIPFTANATIICNPEARLFMNNKGGATTINNLTLNGWNAVAFNANAATSITGTLAAGNGCNEWNWLRSSSFGTQAAVSFFTPHVISDAICQDINITSANLTNNNGVDLSNNAGITFVTPLAGQTYYWVGATTGNTKASIYSTGINNDWSNPDNWALSSGGPFGSNACVPGSHDDVVFDASSFSAGANDVEIDIPFVFCNDMTWTGIPAGVTFDDGGTSPLRVMYVFGNLTWGGSNMTNNYEGKTLFTATDAIARTITNNSSRFYGAVEFDYPASVWNLADNMDVQGDSEGDLTITTGTLSVGNNNINLDGDWLVEADGTYTFTGGGSATVTFDGGTSAGLQLITVNGTSSFNNLTVNRVNGVWQDQYSVQLATPISIDKDFIITGGRFYDIGFQVTGNATGTMSMAASTRLVIGTTGISTVFPTGYMASNITLNATSVVYYYSSLAQTVSGVPDYGELYLANTSATLKTKTLTEPVLIQTRLHIEGYNNFYDDGHQVSFDGAGTNTLSMLANAILTLGNAAAATTFPVNYTPGAVSFTHTGSGSTVIYNGGSAQAIEGLNGGGNQSYSNVELVQPGVGSVTKTLNANAIIRGNLTIGADNELDVSASDYSITMGGNWTNNGTYTARNGTATFNGTAAQTIAGSTSTPFYNAVFNNSFGSTPQLVLGINTNVDNALTMTQGNVNLASYTLQLGTAASTPGSLSRTAGYLYNGNFKRWFNNVTIADGNVAGLFPMGATLFGYAPFYVSAPSVAPATGGSMTISYTDPNTNVWVSFPDGASTVERRHDEVWTLSTADGLAGGTYNLSAERTFPAGAVADITDLRLTLIGSVVGTHGVNAGTILTPQVNRTGLTLAELSNNFYIGSINRINSPLPVVLLNFTATPLDNKFVTINWVTLSEINSDFFALEKSSDGISFEQFAVVDGVGNSTQKLTYTFIDESPYRGTSYYRLKQVDFDGNYDYSPIAAVNLSTENIFGFNVYPNPSGGEVTVVSDYQHISFVSVENLLGESILRSENFREKINLSLPAKGTYILRFVTTTGETNTQKLIIQ